MTLQELGEQYLCEAEQLRKLISGYSARAKNMNGIELYDINTKIVILKEMERDTRILGEKLKFYYDKDSKGKPYRKHLTNTQYQTII